MGRVFQVAGLPHFDLPGRTRCQASPCLVQAAVIPGLPIDTLLASCQTRRGRLSFKAKEAVCGGLLLLTVVERWEDKRSFGLLVLCSWCFVLGAWKTRGNGGVAKESNLSASLFLPERASRSST